MQNWMNSKLLGWAQLHSFRKLKTRKLVMVGWWQKVYGSHYYKARFDGIRYDDGTVMLEYYENNTLNLLKDLLEPMGINQLRARAWKGEGKKDQKLRAYLLYGSQKQWLITYNGFFTVAQKLQPSYIYVSQWENGCDNENLLLTLIRAICIPIKQERRGNIVFLRKGACGRIVTEENSSFFKVHKIYFDLDSVLEPWNVAQREA